MTAQSKLQSRLARIKAGTHREDTAFLLKLVEEYRDAIAEIEQFGIDGSFYNCVAACTRVEEKAERLASEGE